MKPPEPSAIRSFSPPLEEERTGTFRHARGEARVVGTPTVSDQPDRAPIPSGCSSAIDSAAQSMDEAMVSEARMRVPQELPPVGSARPVVAARHCRVLLAVSSEAVTDAFLPVIRALDAAVVKVEDGSALEQALRDRGPFDLVLSDSHLPGGTGLGILAGMRRSGQKPPFVFVQSIHQQLVRVVVGGGPRGVLSTRVVNDLALVELAEELLGLHDAPTSSRRPPRSMKGVAGT